MSSMIIAPKWVLSGSPLLLRLGCLFILYRVLSLYRHSGLKNP